MTSPLIAQQQYLPLGERVTKQSRLSGLSSAQPTAVLDTYWRFAVERQQIFNKRLKGMPPPWTEDPVLRRHRFTNVYRASDRVSQYLIKHVIYNGDQAAEEVFFRTILFKIFNRIDTWELLHTKVGTVAWSDYNFQAYDKILTQAITSGVPIYSAAYIMPSGGRRSKHRYKHSMHLKLLEKMMREQVPQRMADARSMREAFDLIKSYPTIGDFLGVPIRHRSELQYADRFFGGGSLLSQAQVHVMESASASRTWGSLTEGDIHYVNGRSTERHARATWLIIPGFVGAASSTNRRPECVLRSFEVRTRDPSRDSRPCTQDQNKAEIFTQGLSRKTLVPAKVEIERCD